MSKEESAIPRSPEQEEAVHRILRASLEVFGTMTLLTEACKVAQNTPLELVQTIEGELKDFVNRMAPLISTLKLKFGAQFPFGVGMGFGPDGSRRSTGL